MAHVLARKPRCSPPAAGSDAGPAARLAFEPVRRPWGQGIFETHFFTKLTDFFYAEQIDNQFFKKGKIRDCMVNLSLPWLQHKPSVSNLYEPSTS